MRYCLICTLFALVCLLPASAQPAPAVHVCVANLEGAGGGVSPTGSRDALIKFLSKVKNLQLELAPLNAAGASDSLTEAKEKKCDYVVTTNLAELRSELSRTPAVGETTPVDTQVFHVTVDYKLNKVSDGAEASTGSFKGTDQGSPQTATVGALRKVADKVADSIKKAGGPAK